MIGEKLKRQLNEKFGEKYDFLLEPDKNYDLNKDTVGVQVVGTHYIYHTKIRSVKYEKTRKDMDNLFEKFKKEGEFETDEWKEIKELIFKYIDINFDRYGIDEEFYKKKVDIMKTTTGLKREINNLKRNSYYPELSKGKAPVMNNVTELIYKNLIRQKFDIITFDLSHFRPKTIKSKQTILCKCHGKFKISPKELFVEGKHCPECQKLNKFELRSFNFVYEVLKPELEQLREKKKEIKFNKLDKHLYFKKPKNDKNIQFKKQCTPLYMNNIRKKNLNKEKDWERIKEINRQRRIKERASLIHGIKDLSPLDKKEINKNKPVNRNRHRKDNERKYSIEELKSVEPGSSIPFKEKIHEINKGFYSNNEIQEFYQYLADKKHGNGVYDMSEFKPDSVYKNGTVICKKHGKFKVSPYNFLDQGFNCPKCSSGRSSIAESFVADSLENIGFKLNRHNENVLSFSEIDIISKDHKFAIEVNGVKFHSNIHRSDKSAKYHQVIKYNELKKKGYQLINIFDDEIPNSGRKIGKEKFLKHLNQIILFDKENKIHKFNKDDIHVKNLGYYKFKDFYENYSTEKYTPRDNDFYAVFYKGYIISVFSLNNKTNVSHNYATNISSDEDLEEIKDFKNHIVFNIRADSFVNYKMRKFGMNEVERELPKASTFPINMGRNKNYKRKEIEDETNYENVIYDCGRFSLVF